MQREVYAAKTESIFEWLNSIIERGYKVYAPFKERFELVEDVEKISLEYENTIIPPKEIVFPQTEKLLEFDISSNKLDAQIPDKENKVIFGIRPCDARAMRILDMVFLKDYLDPYYFVRKSGTILVVLACKEYCRDGFCNAVGSSPADSEGADIMITEIDDNRYLIEVITDAGRELVENKFEKSDEIEKELPEPVYSKDLSKADEWLSEKFESEEWEKFARKCIGCGICTFLCPTCHCFDITDTKDCRIRTWDSCQFPEYTVHTSGHNPRPERVHRMRNRVLHKFLYFKERNNVIMCVGCGRCIRHCPESIDIRRIVESMED